MDLTTLFQRLIMKHKTLRLRGMRMQPKPSPYLAAAAGLGALALINDVLLHPYAISTAIAILLYILVLVLAYVGGRSARRQDARPGWIGAAIGAVFGLIAGLSSFLIRATTRDIDVPAKGLSRLKLLALANSPEAHVAAVATAVLTFGIIALIIGWIGGLTAKAGDLNAKRPDSA